MVGIQPPTSVLRGGVGRGSGGGLLSPSQFFRSPPAPTTTLQQQRRQQQPSPQHRATLITSNTTKDINTHLSLESMVICSNARSITVPPPDTTSTAATAGTGTSNSNNNDNASTKTIHTSNNDCDNDSLFYQGISININANNHNDTYADNDIGNGEEKKEDEAVDYCNNNTFDGKGKNRGRDNHCINIDDISNNNNIIDGNNHDENGEPKRASNVKVCIRLRPMLPSDSIDADTNAKYYDNIKTTTTAMKRHSSGLITPSSFSSALKRTTLTPTTTKSSTRRITNGAADRLEDNTMDAQKNNVAPISSSSSTLLLPKPAWITHPTNPHRITQSIHPTTTTTTGGSSSSGGGISTTSTNSNSNNSATTIPAADYTFDRVYGPNESTIKLYNENIQSIVTSVVKGYHGSVFAYGQTNSGKTHTMTGNKSSIGGSGNDSGTGNEEEDSMGVIRLAVRDIFHQIQHSSKRHSTTTTTSTTSASSTSSREYLVRVSYLEIYNEQIYDLLVAPSSSQLASASSSSLIIQNNHHHVPSSSVPSLSPSIIRIFESRTEGVVIRGLREEIVTCPEDVFALLDAGDARRKVGSTALNKTSSRSHSVFRLVLESRCCAAAAAAAADSLTSSSTIMTSSSSGGSATAGFEGPVRISSLSLVDLAGSESVKATGSTGLRQKEGQYINKSLLTLGHVIHKLSEMSSREVISDGKGNQEHIPYRDSKLTRLLQPSLGGNAQVCIICNVSPSPKNAEESHNTLKFAMRAKRIVQYARITEVVDKNTLLRSYREEIEELKRQLREARKTAMASDEKLVIQNQSNQHVHETPMSKVRSSSFSNGDHHDEDDDDDDDDAHVLVSAIANLESLILKTGARCSSRKTNRSTSKSISSTIATKTVGESIDESSPSEPSRALDVVLLKAETSDITTDDVASDMMSSPGVTSDDSVLIKSCVSTPSAITQPNEGGDVDDPNLLEELHRIQSMLGTVMKKKRRGTFGGAKSTPGGSDGSNKVEYRTPKRDAEMERLRMQLQEQEVASTMRKADSSFLQNQLNEKEGILQEVAVLLEALERRQLELENENKQLKNDLAEAVQLIEEAEAARQILEKQSSERDAIS